MQHKQFGIAVVGSGRIGLRRAERAAAHPAVNFIAVSDPDRARAQKLAGKVGADFYSDDNLEIMSRPEVGAVIVSSSEGEHVLPALQAISLGKPVLIEKPIAMRLNEADRILAAAASAGVDVHVGYSRRFKRSYLLMKEQIAQGRLGQIIGANTRAYNTRAHHLEVLARTPTATIVMGALTYYVDLICWFLEGNAPVEVVARGQRAVFKAAGYDVDDVAWAILTFADGAVVSLGVDYALPAKYPTFGASARMELLGTEGVFLIDDDNRDQVLFSDRGIPHNYVPEHNINMAFMSSSSSGDWAQGEFWGPLADETRNWLDHLSTGRPCCLATGKQARTTLEITLAIDRAIQTNQSIRIPAEK